MLLLKHVLIWLAFVLALGCGRSDSLPAAEHVPFSTQDEAGAAPAKEFTLYVDPKFTASQRSMIQNACNVWTEATRHKVAFSVYWDVQRPGPYQFFEGFDTPNLIYVWFLDKSDPIDVTPKMRAEWATYSGLMSPNTTSLIMYQSIMPYYFNKVIIHEVGHLIGLEHTPEGVWSLMEPHAEAHCLTQYEYDAACILYNCVPLKQDPACKDPFVSYR